MIYVLSDVHGRMDRLQSILDQIHLQEDDTLYVLGDVVDRNPDGIKILRKLMDMPNVIFLLGNHEHMMLDALQKRGLPKSLERWNRNGGTVTFHHWNMSDENVQRDVVEYLQSAKINEIVRVGEKKFLLVHAAPTECWDPEIRIYRDATMFAVWERMDGYYPFDEDDPRIIVFGHTPTLFFDSTLPFKIWYGEKTIGIDCGAAYPEGRLACLRLDDMKEFYSE